MTIEEYVPDSRESYYNAVISLADILLPYFDNKIKSKYEKYIKLLDMMTKEAYENLKKEIEDYFGKDKELSSERKTSYITEKKLNYARLLFRELNLLLHRIDYLKSALFGEGAEEEEVDFLLTPPVNRMHQDLMPAGSKCVFQWIS